MTSPPATRWTVRLRRAPAYDPPYDDERHPDVWGALPQPLLDLPASRMDPRRLTGGGPARREPLGHATASPPAKSAAARFLHTCLEIVNGLRPASHIRMLARPLEAAEVLAVVTHGSRRLQQAVRPRTVPDGRAGSRAGGRGDGQIRLRRMRTCEPRPGAVEIAAVIGTRDRAWAAAFRLESRHGRWQCTAAAIL